MNEPTTPSSIIAASVIVISRLSYYGQLFVRIYQLCVISLKIHHDSYFYFVYLRRVFLKQIMIDWSAVKFMGNIYIKSLQVNYNCMLEVFLFFLWRIHRKLMSIFFLQEICEVDDWRKLFIESLFRVLLISRANRYFREFFGIKIKYIFFFKQLFINYFYIFLFGQKVTSSLLQKKSFECYLTYLRKSGSSRIILVFFNIALLQGKMYFIEDTFLKKRNECKTQGDHFFFSLEIKLQSNS